jgi:hypothetical protein
MNMTQTQKPNDGGPAFPSADHWWNTRTQQHDPVGHPRGDEADVEHHREGGNP